MSSLTPARQPPGDVLAIRSIVKLRIYNYCCNVSTTIIIVLLVLLLYYSHYYCNCTDYDQFSN